MEDRVTKNGIVTSICGLLSFALVQYDINEAICCMQVSLKTSLAQTACLGTAHLRLFASNDTADAEMGEKQGIERRQGVVKFVNFNISSHHNDND